MKQVVNELQVLNLKGESFLGSDKYGNVVKKEFPLPMNYHLYEEFSIPKNSTELLFKIKENTELVVVSGYSTVNDNFFPFEIQLPDNFSATSLFVQNITNKKVPIIFSNESGIKSLPKSNDHIIKSSFQMLNLNPKSRVELSKIGDKNFFVKNFTEFDLSYLG
ncbi:hypothetical protein PL373_09985 [Tenacibaculum maritimum]|nr:hypothetical protein [Tenacibaculum maritimum]MDB0601474.1 hypothetical protein [Tenacibaculum maritimum]MDB0612981.1 hypothetical protein [Tenacibaculum maritimum]